MRIQLAHMSELAWRLAARVRTLLAHPRAGASPVRESDWQALLADADARFATGLTLDAVPADAPEWLSLPMKFASQRASQS